MMVLSEKTLIMYSSIGGASQINTVRVFYLKVHRLQYLRNHHEFLTGICENRMKPQIRENQQMTINELWEVAVGNTDSAPLCQISNCPLFDKAKM